MRPTSGAGGERATRRVLLAAACAVATLAALTACGGYTGGTAARWSPAGDASPEAATSSPLPPVPSSAAPTVTAGASAAPSGPVVPRGVTAAIAVFDRRTGAFTERRNVTMRFRSASLVKLLIALDYLWERGPGYAVPAADRNRLDLMLRSSDDDMASYFYRRAGSEAVVKRMVARLGLQNTTPPAPPRTGWGSTAVSAADIVRVYRYLLDTAPAAVRDLVIGDLRQSTRCATDGFDQTFGIPSAFGRPWAVKQAWYEFAGTTSRGCTANAAAGPGAVTEEGAPLTASAVRGAPSWETVAAPAGDGVDWNGEVLHTTGTVGAGDRSIVVVLTVHRAGTTFATASTALTKLTGSLRLAGAG
jgi:hypothetical protein